MLDSRMRSRGGFRRNHDHPVRSVWSVLLECGVSLDDADRCDLLVREGGNLISLEPNAVDDEE
jgi:hypothetical protein